MKRRGVATVLAASREHRASLTIQKKLRARQEKKAQRQLASKWSLDRTGTIATPVVKICSMRGKRSRVFAVHPGLGFSTRTVEAESSGKTPTITNIHSDQMVFFAGPSVEHECVRAASARTTGAASGERRALHSSHALAHRGIPPASLSVSRSAAAPTCRSSAAATLRST